MDKMLKLSGYTVSTMNSYPSRESLRVLSAAVVSKRFRQILLSDPRRAIASGYAVPHGRSRNRLDVVHPSRKPGRICPPDE